MKKVLVTGGMSALGQAVIEHLKNMKTFQICATSSRVQPSFYNQVKFSFCNFQNLEQLTAIFDEIGPDLILHLGANTFLENFVAGYNINVAPAIHLINLIQSRGFKTRLVLIGSAAEYGIVAPEENPISEEHALLPVSVYGVSKAWQTQLLGLSIDQGVDVVCARIFNLFGPGISERLFAGKVQNQINEIKLQRRISIEIGSLTAIRDYISTSDAAHQLLIIATRGISGNVYHIGSGSPTSMHDFLINQLHLHGVPNTLIHESKSHSNHRGYDVPMIYANMKKTQNLELQE